MIPAYEFHDNQKGRAGVTCRLGLGVAGFEIPTMTERSFRKEVRDLRLGEGEEFRGEGILAVAKALLQCGVSYVGGYQGAPVSHLMDVFADAHELFDELGIHFERCASEAAAAAMLGASINYPIRGAATWKSTVGTNVASDALSNLASAGVRGGALIIVGEDYGEGASIIQERSHAFAMKSQVWLLDPRPNLPTLVRMVEKGFELSEASRTPVMLEMRIRACHVHGRFLCKDNRRGVISAHAPLSEAEFDYARGVHAAFDLRPGEGQGRATLAGGSRLHPRRAPQRGVRRPRERHRHHRTRRHVQRRGARLAVSRPVRRLRREHGAALRAQRDLSARALRGREVLPGQAIGAHCRGRPAGLPRASDQGDAGRRRRRHQSARQGLSADGGGVHRRGVARRHRSVSERRSRERSRQRIDRATPRGAGRSAEAGGRGLREPLADAPARLLHRLSGASGVHRHEAGRAPGRQVPRLGRHRVPHLLHVAAVQPRQYGARLRARPVELDRRRRQHGPAGGQRHGRRRVLAQRAHQRHRQRGVQSRRRRARHHEQRLHRRHRSSGDPFLGARRRTKCSGARHRAGIARRRGCNGSAGSAATASARWRRPSGTR